MTSTGSNKEVRNLIWNGWNIKVDKRKNRACLTREGNEMPLHFATFRSLMSTFPLVKIEDTIEYEIYGKKKKNPVLKIS
jgi:hypothetical protein